MCDMETMKNRRDNMKIHLINLLTNKALNLQSEGKWEAADRFLIFTLRIGG